MKKQDAINYFGSSTALAKELNISTQSISQWTEEVPMRRALEIEHITSGALKSGFTPARQETNSDEQE